MTNQIRFFSLMLFAQFTFMTLVVAPGVIGSRAMAQGSSQTEISGTRKQMATIIFAGLGGAVLGLSTLSFYGRPQDHLSNIAIGFAVGVVVGTIYTTYQVIHAPYEQYQVSNFYQKQDQLLRTDFYLSEVRTKNPQEADFLRAPMAWSWSF